MELNEATNRFFQYLRVEKGVSNDTIDSYHYDLNEFFTSLNKKSTDDFLQTDITDFIKLQSKRLLSP